jgi:hypothetical protein
VDVFGRIATKNVHRTRRRSLNPALGRHPRFRQNVEELKNWGLSVLWDDPTPEALSWMAPWPAIIEELRARTSA